VSAPTLDRIRSALVCGRQGCECARPRGNSHCPAHDDKTPSLSVSLKRDRSGLLLHCFAQCSYQAIIDALRPRGLWPTTTDYYLSNGYRHRRIDGADGTKKMYWVKPAGGLGLDGTPVSALPLYNEEALTELPDGATVVLVEGEKAATALHARGVPAVGTVCGAKSTPSADVLQVLTRFDVVLWPDNDEAGEAHMRRIADRLLELGIQPRRFDPTGLPEKGDAADWRGTDEELGWAIASAVPYERNEKGSGLPARPAGPPPEPPWPDPPHEAAFYGLAGELVRAIEPYTEADPVAVLANILAAFGNAVGRGAWVNVGATRHHPNLFIILVGPTAKGRKGESWSPVRVLFAAAAPDWAALIKSGLSSGEGLIHAVRDPVIRRQEGKEKGRPTGRWEEVVVDEGVADKRLLVIEAELGRTLSVLERQGNTLSAVLRDAWDGNDLGIMTRANAARATAPHISLIGHITQQELERELYDVSLANGFANRFLVLAVRRSRLLPIPPVFGDELVARLAARLAEAIAFAAQVGEVKWGPAARDLWIAMYPDLSRGEPGLAGAIAARSEAHVLRLSLIYALLDGSNVIDVPHLAAAAALWEYAAASVRYIFGDRLGDPTADSIRQMLATSPLTRSEISAGLGRHVRAAAIDHALHLLLIRGIAFVRHEETGGRPREIWELVEQVP
jgi:hypothetical protein